MDLATVKIASAGCEKCRRRLIRGEACYKHLTYFFCVKCAVGMSREELATYTLKRPR